MAGSGALIPLKGGASPTMRSPAGGLLAMMPSGDRGPIALPRLAKGKQILQNNTTKSVDTIRGYTRYAQQVGGARG
jgi:hypothetical protein